MTILATRYIYPMNHLHRFMLRLFMPLAAVFEWVYRAVPWPATARNKVRAAIALWVTMVGLPLFGQYVLGLWWFGTAMLPLTMTMGWCSGRLIASACLPQHDAEQP